MKQTTPVDHSRTTDKISLVNPYKSDDEIDLIELIRTIWKRKIGIISIFLITVILAAGISLILPKTFESESLIKIGLVKEFEIESIEKIRGFFKTETILKEIFEKLDLPSYTTPTALIGEFNMIIDKEKLGFLSIKGRGITPEKALELTTTIDAILLTRHQKLFSEAGKLLDIEIKNIKENQEKIKEDIEQRKKEIARLEEDISHYEQEIANKGNAYSEGQGRIVESYINLLASAKDQQDRKSLQILNLKQSLITLNENLQQKEFEKVYTTTPTTVEVEPTLPETRISPKRAQITAIAGFLGLFIAILWSIIAEYFQYNKSFNRNKLD